MIAACWCILLIVLALVVLVTGSPVPPGIGGGILLVLAAFLGVRASGLVSVFSVPFLRAAPGAAGPRECATGGGRAASTTVR
jgi:hypothetical protein